MQKVRYEVPELEVLDAVVEAGFAASQLENPEEGEID